MSATRIDLAILHRHLSAMRRETVDEMCEALAREESPCAWLALLAQLQGALSAIKDTAKDG